MGMPFLHQWLSTVNCQLSLRIFRILLFILNTNYHEFTMNGWRGLDVWELLFYGLKILIIFCVRLQICRNRILLIRFWERWFLRFRDAQLSKVHRTFFSPARWAISTWYTPHTKRGCSHSVATSTSATLLRVCLFEAIKASNSCQIQNMRFANSPIL